MIYQHEHSGYLYSYRPKHGRRWLHSQQMQKTNSFTAELKKFRKEKNLTVQQIAAELSVQMRSVNYWLVGKNLPHKDRQEIILQRIANFKSAA